MNTCATEDLYIKVHTAARVSLQYQFQMTAWGFFQQHLSEEVISFLIINSICTIVYSLETLLILAPSNFGFHNTGDKTLVCKRNRYYNLLTANGDDIDKIMAGELRYWGQLKRIPVSELKCRLLGTHTHISIGMWGAWDTSVYTTRRSPCPRSAYSLPDLSLEVTPSQNCPKLNSLLGPNVRMAARLLHLSKQTLYSLDNPISPRLLPATWWPTPVVQVPRMALLLSVTSTLVSWADRHSVPAQTQAALKEDYPTPSKSERARTAYPLPGLPLSPTSACPKGANPGALGWGWGLL